MLGCDHDHRWQWSARSLRLSESRTTRFQDAAACNRKLHAESHRHIGCGISVEPVCRWQSGSHRRHNVTTDDADRTQYVKRTEVGHSELPGESLCEQSLSA